MDSEHATLKGKTLAEKADHELERVIPESLNISPEKRVFLAVGWSLTFSGFFSTWLFRIALYQKQQFPPLVEAIWFVGSGIWVPTVIFGFTYSTLLRLKLCRVYNKRTRKSDCEFGGVFFEECVAKGLSGVTRKEWNELMNVAITKRSNASNFMEVVITVFWLGVAFICGIILRTFRG